MRVSVPLRLALHELKYPIDSEPRQNKAHESVDCLLQIPESRRTCMIQIFKEGLIRKAIMNNA
ncbi:hypothetical protein YC2023_089020 [Brassica napus]